MSGRMELNYVKIQFDARIFIHNLRVKFWEFCTGRKGKTCVRCI